MVLIYDRQAAMYARAREMEYSISMSDRSGLTRQRLGVGDVNRRNKKTRYKRWP